MRNPLVFAPVVLALGLATYFVASPGREPAARAPDVAGREPATRESALPENVPRAAPASTIARAPAETRVTQTPVPSAEQPFEEDLALATPPAEDEVELSEGPVPPLESPQQRADRLIAAGFSGERAAAIVQAESKLRAAAAYDEYQRSGTVRALNASAAGTAEGALREELGDADYERYLAALGRPTRVVVRDIEPGSAAANAGILPGDEIRSYRGRRVFDVGELNASMLEGGIGQTVPATIVRDGQALQLYVDGGELGIAPRSAL